MLDNPEEFWFASWIKHIEGYLESKPRAGIFIDNYFKNKKINSILEIAGGSCRDSRHLANLGYDTTGSDFDDKTLNYLQSKRFPNDKLKYSKEDAFSLSFDDNNFDLIFHNGFFIYFNNADIISMLKEQERVAKKYIVIFVHNRENEKLVKNFKELSREDDLYKIRFFDKDEIKEIVVESDIRFKDIKILKLGGLFDAFYKKRVKKLPNILYPFRKMIVPKLYQFQKWENVERICCIVELDK